ncbi:hypothetical protein FXN63_19045 [Pigmentiphaga aceris]|uniref:DUF2059 domain-containing protein n=1 Tax=Pigmentiphaga aceris TaxID=1940612 RepID=A0A5C0AZ40_9BURK|nr:hypothetical protein [Pigmentiphaga aceris]QEI07699.1 hypothetical protein FXN63_19045 [Pigmentiphaga aceris]
MLKNLLTIVLFAAINIFPAVSSANSAQDAAYSFVTKQRLGHNFETTARGLIEESAPYMGLVQQLGAVKAKRLVSDEFNARIDVYLTRWERSLANVFAKHFTAQELSSLTAEGGASAHRAKFVQKQTVIEQDISAATKPVLKEFVTEVLGRAMAKSRS